MINAIIKGIINLIIGLVDIVLLPIDALILQFLPDLSNAFTLVGDLFEYATNFLGFIVSMTGLSSTAISLIIAYYTFILTVPLLISTIKLAIKWYNALKL